MAWPAGWPPVHSTDPAVATDIDLYTWLIHIWKATRERSWAAGQEFFPRTTITHDTEPYPTSFAAAYQYTGIIDSFATSDGGATFVLTDGSKVWPTPNRWVGYDNSATPWQPQNYDCIIEYDELEPWGVVRANITASTATTLTLDGGPIEDAAAARQISSTAAAGKRYCIVRRDSSAHRSLHWHDRWLDWPNANEYARGTVYSSTTTSLTNDVPEAPIADNSLSGNIFFLTAAGRLQRSGVTGNTTDPATGALTITFANIGFAPGVGASYAVCRNAADQRWRPNAPRSYPFRWYGGADRSASGMINSPERYSHDFDDVLRAAPVATTVLTIQEDDATLGCATVSHSNAFDNDFWTGYDNVGLYCGAARADKPYAPDFYKSLRGIQQNLENGCASFVEKRVYDGQPDIPPFVTARWFKASGINHYTVTVSSVSGNTLTFTPAIANANLSASDYPVHWAVLLNAVGTVPVTPTGHGVDGTLDSASSLTVPAADASWAGKTLVISLGWTRRHPRTFKTMYDKQCFLPGGNPLADPPTEANPGSYLTRGKSTTYSVPDSFGQVIEGPESFIDGLVARYVGDNFYDPTMTTDAPPTIEPDTYYRDRLFTGVRVPPSGTATVASIAAPGGYHCLTDSTKSFNGDGVLITHTGTASGGGTTGLTDSSKGASSFWNGTNGRSWVGFIVQVQAADGAWHKRPITSHTTTTTLGFAPALPFGASGRPYKIEEPRYKLNDYKGRSLQFGGVTATITHNDTETLFFAEQAVAIPAGMPYRVIEEQPGTTWKRQGGAWVKPAGADPRGATWMEDSRGNLPDVKVAYGKLMKGDYITRELFVEIKAAIDSLAWIRFDVGSWVSGPLGTELNQKSGLQCGDPTWPGAQAKALEIYNSPASLTSYGAPPFADGSGFGQSAEYFAKADRRQAYWVPARFGTRRLSHSVEFYNYGTLDAQDTPPQENINLDTPYLQFNDHGDPVSYHLWRLWGSLGAANTYERMSPLMGSLANPNFGAAPNTNGLFCHFQYYVYNTCIIVKWDVAGGMTYVP